ncbi:MAG: RHS repeat-associated core domain-containing protein [Sulfurimonas sp.]
MNKLLLLFLVWLYPVISFSAIDECKTDIYYGNGILAEDEDARKIVKDILRPNIQKERFNDDETEMKKHIGEVGYSYNQTNGFILDGLETYLQKLNIQLFVDAWSLAHGYISNHLEDYIGHYNKYAARIRDGHRVLVVAHSQGNLFTDVIYKRLGSQSKEAWMQQYFGAVSVASPMNADISNDTERITWDNDIVGRWVAHNGTSASDEVINPIRRIEWEYGPCLITEENCTLPLPAPYAKKSDIGKVVGGSNKPQKIIYEKEQYFYHPDHLGSSSFVTDERGKVYEHLEYFPYGETFAHEHSNTQVTPYRFTGKELDEVTGLYYYGARYYDPRTSVWQSPDPILNQYMFGEGNGGVYNPFNLKLYTYTYNNPVTLVDPDGQITKLAKAAYNVLSKTYKHGDIKKAGKDELLSIYDNVSELVDGDLTADDFYAAVDLFTGFGGEAKDAAKTIKSFSKNDEFVDLASPQRRKHILDGDATGGGHRSGTGKPGKSEFPKSWSDDKVMHEISDIATDPTLKARPSRGGRTITEGTRDGIDIRVVQEKTGDIISGFPTNVPRNPK